MESYEQKYKAALEWMRDVYLTLTGASKEDAEHYFPELTEREDEKIRCSIIAVVNEFWDRLGSISPEFPTRAEMITYLKKQKEQKLVEWSEEDRKILNTIISDGSRGVEFDAKQVNWLKSLCSQYRWKPSEQEKGALQTAIHILTDERNFPKAAAHLQNILDAFGGEEPRKDWKPSDEQMNALKNIAYGSYQIGDGPVLRELYDNLKKL